MPIHTIDLIAGARPNFMKVAAIIRALDRQEREGGSLRYRFVHTGQHYDDRMSGDFFDQLGLPAPAINLGVGSGTHAEQTAMIMTRYEATLRESRPILCVVVGDVTSTMACAITAQKMHVQVAHVEGGIRSGDWEMPEEINRMVTDAITNYFFTTSETANENLRRTGVGEDRIFFVGNTMIDTLLANRTRFRPPTFWTDLSLKDRGYLVLTLHRPANVDAPDRLSSLLSAFSRSASALPVIFPVHPRTMQTIQSINNIPSNIIVVDPQPYLEFNYLVTRALAVVTDSGGVTEETTVLGVPCMTLRKTTERPETVTLGTNELIGTDPAALELALSRLLSGRWKKGLIPPLWDGGAAQRIVDHLTRLISQQAK